MRLQRFGPVEHGHADAQFETGGNDSAPDPAGTTEQGDARPRHGTEPPSVACREDRFVHDGQKCVARSTGVNRGSIPSRSHR